MFSYRFVFVLLLGLSCSNLLAQEQSGLRLSNYAGINGVLLNPAWPVESRLAWDVNLAAAGAHVYNNHFFVRNAGAISLLKSDFETVEFIGVFDLEGEPREGDFVYDFERTRKIRSFVNTIVTGPSFMVNLESGHSFGFFTNVRSHVSLPNAPNTLGFYGVFALRDSIMQDFSIAPFDIAAMGWSEIGGYYGRKVELADGSFLTVAGSLKFLQGYESVYFRNNSTVGVSGIGTDSIDVIGGDFDLNFATNFQFDNAGVTDYSFQRNGSGLAADIGLTYTFPSYNYNNDHLWKVGISIVDFGAIGFNRNAQAHNFQLQNLIDSVTFYTNEFQDVSSTDEFVELLSDKVFNNSSQSRVQDNFAMWLPTGISIQGELAFVKHFYVSAMYTQRLRLSKQSVARANSFLIAPRFESRWLEASLPLSTNGQEFRLGASLRLGPLTVGSDNLLSWVSNNRDLYGTDVYVALRINPFFSMKGGRGGGYNKVKCYQF